MEPGSVLLEGRLDEGEEAAAILAVLAERYEIATLEAGNLFRVAVDDADDPDEAVVRLASVLDDIEQNWERCFRWPRSG